MANIKQPAKPNTRQRRAAFQAAMYANRQRRLDRVAALATPQSTPVPSDEDELAEES